MQVETDKLGKFLKEMRQSRKISLRLLERLSKEKGNEDLGSLTYTHISKIERGKSSPTIRTLQKFASALNLSFTVFLDGGEADLDTVTIISTDAVSKKMMQALRSEEVMQLLLACHDLSEEQVKSLLSVAESINKLRLREKE